MKKVLLGAAVAAVFGGLAFAPNAIAEPSDACSAGQVPGVVSGSQSGTGGTLTVCISDDNSPIQGNATAQGTADTGGSVIADGDTTNEGPLVGYAGVEIQDNTPTPVSSGCPADYDGSGDPATAESTIEFIQAGGVSDCG